MAKLGAYPPLESLSRPFVGRVGEVDATRALTEVFNNLVYSVLNTLSIKFFEYLSMRVFDQLPDYQVL